jgi:hypothetical protein
MIRTPEGTTTTIRKRDLKYESNSSKTEKSQK